MKKHIIFVNTRATAGDPAKESFVGVYRDNRLGSLKKALKLIAHAATHKRIPSCSCVAFFRKELDILGWRAEDLESVFVPIASQFPKPQASKKGK